VICQLHHLPHDQGSSNQAAQCKESFIEQGWSVFLQNGFTKDTYWTHPNQYEIMKGSRLDGFSKENKNKAETKRACVMNHVRFWERVAVADMPMAFIEHDAIAIAPPEEVKFEEVLILNLDNAFNFGALKDKFRPWSAPSYPHTNVADLPHDYPLTCNVKGSHYFGAKMIPGTAAYAITPQGARTMLDVVATRGLEQSDYILNEMNVVLQYLTPSPIKFNTVNLSTSHG
jgi:hypothetical protein|tara:strand:+ start:4509 stop:5195 length:687 start_codon:yes stop_codon:yes gene_type:complete